MDVDILIILGAIFLLLVCSAFFSGSETALTAASRARMFQLEKKGDSSAAIVNQLIAIREQLIGAVLLGNNLVNILASALATTLALRMFGDTGVVYATLGMTALVFVFAEVLPKTYALINSDGMALRVAPILRPYVRVVSPITTLVEKFIRLLLRGLGFKAEESGFSAHEEIRGAIDLHHQEGAFVKSDRDMLGGILDLKELEVSDIMIHRTKMETINADDAPETIVKNVLSSHYTRLPLWRDSPENIIGVLHAKDLLRAIDQSETGTEGIEIEKIASAPWFVPDSTSLEDQLRAFLKRKNHFALVVDEYGEMQGLVTLEDILEEIVGDIRDEHDVSITGVRAQPDGWVVVDGSVPIRDLNRAMDWALPDDEATTIAGLVIHEARLIPEPGQAFTFHNFRFEVLKRTRNKITSLRLRPLSSFKRNEAPVES